MKEVLRSIFSAHDRFEIVSKLGDGGMGVVYAAYDRERQEKVALKTLRTADPQAVYRLKNEFRSLQDMQHRNLVSFGELFESDGQWYFTMELVDGLNFVQYVRGDGVGNSAAAEDIVSGVVNVPAEVCDFSKRSPADMVGESVTGKPVVDGHMDLIFAEETSVDKTEPDFSGFGDGVSGEGVTQAGIGGGGFDEQRLREALVQLADGLSVLHESGRVHRDIKPSNILVDGKGRVVLLDFGIVKKSDSGESTDHIGPLGTAAYMAPEQAQSEEVGPEADWYSVGVVLFEALTGRLPFEGTIYKVLLDKSSKDPPRPRDYAPETPRDLDDLCVRLMHRDPLQRPDEAFVLSLLKAYVSSKNEPDVTRYKTRVPVFVGCEREIELLEETLAAASEEPRVVLVHGPTGLGKSELMRVFAQRVLDGPEEAVVLLGRCYERESVPFKAFDGVVDSLSRLLQKMSEREVLALAPRDAPLLLRVFPVLGRVAALDVEAGSRRVIEDMQMIRTLAFAALRDLFTRFADRCPVLIVIDDFQWADDDSRRLLRTLLEPPDPPAICLFLTLRTPADLDRAALEVEKVKEAVPIDLLNIPLKPLSIETSVTLAEKLFFEYSDKKFVEVLAEKIARESEGHPFFIQELVRYAQDLGGTGETLSLDQVLEARVAALERPLCELLELVCICGSPVRQDIIGRILKANAADVSRRVTQLRWMNLLRSHGPRPEDCVEPYNARVCEWMAGRPAAYDRKRYHRLLFRELKSLGDAPLEKLVMHLEEAGEPKAAVRYTVAAALNASKLLAFDRAAALYRKALESWPESKKTDDIEERRRLMVGLAESLAMAGRGGEAADAYLEAAVGANAAETLRMEHLAASQLLMSGRLDKGLEIIERVAGRLGLRIPRTPLGALVSLLLRRIHIRLRGLGFKLRDSSQVSPEELERVDFWRSLALGLGASDNMRAADFNTRWVMKSLEIGEPVRVVQALALESVFVASLGKRSTNYFSRLKKTVNQLLKEKDFEVARAYLAAVDGYGAFMAGEWRASLDAFERAEFLMPSSASAFHELATVRFSILWSQFYLGELDAMTTRLTGLVRMAMDRGDIFAASGMFLGLANVAYLNRDGPESARREVDTMIGRWSTKGYHLQHYWALLARVHIALYKGSGKEALDMVESDRPAFKKSLLSMIPAVANEGAHLLGRALVAAAAESEPSTGKPMLRKAAKIARRLGRKKLGWMRALALLLDGAVCFQRGNLDESKMRLEAAVEALDAQEMGLYAASARWRLADIVLGDEGEELRRAALGFMKRQKVNDMESIINLLAPGY